jgi:sugar/nucleoside kinase (ribokinase family)
LEIAARASAISVSREGASASIPFLKEVNEAKLYYK